MLVKRTNAFIVIICLFLLFLTGCSHSKTDYQMSKENKIILKVLECQPVNEEEIKIFNEIRSRIEPETLDETLIYIADRLSEDIEYKMTHGQEDKITDHELQFFINSHKTSIALYLMEITNCKSETLFDNITILNDSYIATTQIEGFKQIEDELGMKIHSSVIESLAMRYLQDIYKEP